MLIILLSTFANKKQADKVLSPLLEEKKIACYLTLPANACFTWKGKRTKAKESLAIIKTTPKNLKEVRHYLIKNHPYETPFISSLKITDTNSSYLKWLTLVTQ